MIGSPTAGNNKSPNSTNDVKGLYILKIDVQNRRAAVVQWLARLPGMHVIRGSSHGCDAIELCVLIHLFISMPVSQQYFNSVSVFGIKMIKVIFLKVSS